MFRTSIYIYLLMLQLSDWQSSKCAPGGQSVAVAIDLVWVDLPPAPVSVVLRGLRAVTDCGDTHLWAEIEGEGWATRETRKGGGGKERSQTDRESEREHGMQRMASNQSSFHQAVSQSVSHSVHRGVGPLDWSRRLVSPTHCELFARWRVHNQIVLKKKQKKIKKIIIIIWGNHTLV